MTDGFTFTGDVDFETLWYQTKVADEERKRMGVTLPTLEEIKKLIAVLGNVKLNDEAIELLGVIPDHEISDRFGLQLHDVYRARWKAGIESFAETAGTYKWTDETDALLGTDYDLYIAKRLGISNTSVRYRRLKLGIKEFAETKTCRVCQKQFTTRKKVAKSCPECKAIGADENYRRNGSRGGKRIGPCGN